MTYKKAREPQWWVDFLNKYYPKVYFGFLNELVEKSPKFRYFLNKLPCKCPFERQFWIGNVLVYYVPPLCKLNPLFPQLMELKVKALNYTE